MLACKADVVVVVVSAAAIALAATARILVDVAVAIVDGRKSGVPVGIAEVYGPDVVVAVENKTVEKVPLERRVRALTQ